MFLNFFLVLYLILNPLQPFQSFEGPQRINHQSLGIKTTAKSVIIIDAETEKILYEKNAHQVLPIASLTKLITALVFLDLATGVAEFGQRQRPLTYPNGTVYSNSNGTIYSSPNRTVYSNKNKTLPSASSGASALKWDKIITIQHKDQAQGATLFVNAGEKVRVKDLFYSMLVGSANNATKALIRSTGLTEEEFVKRMNQKATVLLSSRVKSYTFSGNSEKKSKDPMAKTSDQKTHFFEPTGLSPQNVSTAYEIALLAKEAFKNEKIREATVMKKYVFRTVDAEILHTIKNTDKLLQSFLNPSLSASPGALTPMPVPGYKIIAGKTGYLEEAGYCLISEVEKNGHRVIGVILGSESGEARFQEMKGLIWWVFENYKMNHEL